MPFRVREVLLVSSFYDAFALEEDGQLGTRLFLGYSELNLSQFTPRITHAPTAARAMELLEERWFDLVITMVHLEDMDVCAFARQIKVAHPRRPVVLLTLQETELRELAERGEAECIDEIFLWTGDARILVAAIKLIEDRHNIDHDTAAAGVRVIIVAEDTVRRYSSFLSMLYAELLGQANSLIAEGVNELQKQMRMRARPKVILAKSYEQAWAHFRAYRSYVYGVISDVRMPRRAKLDAEAGFDLAQALRREDADLPILLQSAESGLAERAEALGVWHADKNSRHLLRSVHGFLVESLGFGEFIFRLPDRTEVGRARDVDEMMRALKDVPAVSLAYHASRNHFSTWLMARAMFRLAARMRGKTVTELGGVEAVRAYLIEVLQEARRQDQEGVIADFTAEDAERRAFVRIGKGSLGGKGRSIAFANSVLARRGLARRFAELPIRIPQTVVIGAQYFEEFVQDSQIAEGVKQLGSDEEILERFLAADLPAMLRQQLEQAMRSLCGPLAIRSSSLLEDSYMRPFAGIYATYLLPNNHQQPAQRLRQVNRAVKAVYASAYFQAARAYIERTPYSIEDERMAVVIQELVGRQHGDRYYPHFSGVASSHNFYPVSGQRSEDGVAALAVGLGEAVVGGGAVVQFSPPQPQVLSQFLTAQQRFRSTQTWFYALDTSQDVVEVGTRPVDLLRRCELEVAEADGTLDIAGSVYDAGDDILRDSLRSRGPRVVTFNNVLKWNAIPLAPAIAELLQVMRQGLGHAVEIEFAVDMGDWGRCPPAGQEAESPTLYLLQIRPQHVQLAGPSPSVEFSAERIFCRSDCALGHGLIDDIHDLIWIGPEVVRDHRTPQIAVEIGRLNAALTAEKRKYFLVGPGRWGSSDPRLGVPVNWPQISGVAAFVEFPLLDQALEPSQGSHFFHNLTSMGIGYLTLPKPQSNAAARGSFVDRPWLASQPIASEATGVRHYRFATPLRCYLDGRAGTGVIVKPA